MIAILKLEHKLLFSGLSLSYFPLWFSLSLIYSAEGPKIVECLLVSELVTSLLSDHSNINDFGPVGFACAKRGGVCNAKLAIVILP